MKRTAIVFLLVMTMVISVAAIGLASAPSLTNDQKFFALGGALSKFYIDNPRDTVVFSLIASTAYEFTSQRRSFEAGLINFLLFNGVNQFFRVTF